MRVITSGCACPGCTEVRNSGELYVIKEPRVYTPVKHNQREL